MFVGNMFTRDVSAAVAVVIVIVIVVTGVVLFLLLLLLYARMLVYTYLVGIVIGIVIEHGRVNDTSIVVSGS
jgi:hypothetical protein